MIHSKPLSSNLFSRGRVVIDINADLLLLKSRVHRPGLAYLSLRVRRNLLYASLSVFSSKLLHQLNQLDQVLVAKQTSAAGRRHKRIFRLHCGPARWQGAQPSLGIVEVAPVLAPVVAICNQLELLAPQRMMWVDDFKNRIGTVVMRCS
jgi:hypothetical protein